MRICLNMIVKDEAHVIERALDSVLGFVDIVVVSDTGSADHTKECVERWGAEHDVDYIIYDDYWIDFATNRNLALTHARSHLTHDDLILFLDADDVLVQNEEAAYLIEFLGGKGRKTEEPTDAYSLQVRYGDTTYSRPALVRAGSAWEWRSPVHEYLHLDGAIIESVTAPAIEVIGGGARSKDPEKYAKDAEVLESVINPDGTATMDDVDPRLVFYLAQSYRDAGKPRQAISNYSWRVDLKRGWDQERYYAAYQIAVLMMRSERVWQRSEYTTSKIVDWLIQAHEIAPHRAEVLWLAAQTLRTRGRPNTALLYARAAIECEPHPDDLFTESDVYAWRRWDEYAMCLAEASLPKPAETLRTGLGAAQRAMIDIPPGHPDEERLAANVGWWAARAGESQ